MSSKILLHCLFPKLIYGLCYTFGAKNILNPLNVAFNDEFRKIFNVARHISGRMIIIGFNALPISLTVVCNLFYMIKNMLKVDEFQQLIAHLFLKSDCYFDLCNLYDINIHMCRAEIKQKLQRLY